MPKQFCVVYRQGGRENFEWKRSLPGDKDEMQKTQEEARRMGYPALLVDYQQSLSIGLPETYDAQTEIPHDWN